MCCGRSSGFGPVELAFLDHVHRLDASQDGTCAVERFEAQHRPHDPLDGPVVLLDEVVDVLRLAQPDVRTGVGAQALGGRRIGAALVEVLSR